MQCTVEEKPKIANTIRNPIYAVGIDEKPNLKEQIARIHGSDSEVMNTVKHNRYPANRTQQYSSGAWPIDKDSYCPLKWLGRIG